MACIHGADASYTRLIFMLKSATVLHPEKVSLSDPTECTAHTYVVVTRNKPFNATHARLAEQAGFPRCEKLNT